KAPDGLNEEQGSIPCASARRSKACRLFQAEELDPAGSRAFTTRSAPSSGWQLLREVISFYKADAGRVVFAAHNRGVVARRECLDESRFQVVGRCKRGRFNLSLLTAAVWLRLPIVVRSDRGSTCIV